MANKIIGEELSAVTVDTAFAGDYFKAHTQNYADSSDKKSKPKVPDFRAVKGRVIQDMKNEKQKLAYQELMQRLLRADNVKIFDDRIK